MTRTGIALCVLSIAFLFGFSGAATANHRIWRPADLIFCYADGTDKIGDVLTQSPDEALEAGIARYSECFTEDAEFNVWFPHQRFNAQAKPDPDVFPPTLPSPVIGFKAWGEFVGGVFRGALYDSTQHLITNVDVKRRGRKATVVAYLNASHVISGTGVGGVSRCVAVANGTYTIKAKWDRRRGWQATALSLTLITFNPVFESGPLGCTVPPEEAN